jgi:hypothetical protein
MEEKMVSRWPKRPRRSRTGEFKTEIGAPKFEVGNEIGDFIVIFYQGHSFVNKRTAKEMSKAQHWYRCQCKCGNIESRSQQELIDPRRQQCCADCRKQNSLTGNRNEN